MPTRTTETAIREIIATNLTGPQVMAFAADASLWVSEELIGLGFSDQRLEVIERYLTCALVRIRDLGLKTSTINDVSETYQADSDVTDYLLRAASFDSTGKVRQHFLAPKPVSLRVGPLLPIKFRVGDSFADQSPKTIIGDGFIVEEQ